MVSLLYGVMCHLAVTEQNYSKSSVKCAVCTQRIRLVLSCEQMVVLSPGAPWVKVFHLTGICFASGKFAPLAQHLQLSDSQRHSSYCHLTTLAAPSWQLRAAPESARSPRIQEMMAVLSLGAVLTEAETADLSSIYSSK